MNKTIPLLGLALLALVASCAPAPQPINQEQLAQADTEADLNALKSRTQEMRQRLDNIESRLGRQGQGVTLEDLNARLTRLEQTVARMAATLGVDTGQGAPQAQAGQAPPPAATGQVAPPAAAAPQPGPGYGQQSEEEEYAPPGPGAPAPVQPQAGPGVAGQASTDPAEAIYNMAMDAFNQRDLDKANSLFSELVKGYPTSPRAPDALFWQAETNYQQGDYGQAALICQDLIQKYPNHPKVPAAMLKQGLAFRKLGKSQAAKTVLQEVVRRYPNSAEARSAQTQLREMQ